jgi:MoxR-like ATPase
METGLVERGTEIRLLLLATISQENILFLGPPGTAKSELALRLSRIFKSKYFERILTRFSVQEELFGPLSMKALEEDQFIRQTKGYLPECQVAFIDEIFKANSAILNSLLTILNERLFDNGNHRYRIPMICLVGASNELPESDELEALYDRFLFRKMVKQVSVTGFSTLISSLSSENKNISPRPYTEASYSSSASPSTPTNRDLHIDRLESDDLISIREEAQKSVHVPNDIILLLTEVRHFLQETTKPPIYVSDRRLVKAVNMLKVAAYTNARDTVNLYDCLLLQHCLWNSPLEQESLLQFLLEKLGATKEVANFEVILQRIFARSCLFLTGSNKDEELQKDLETLHSSVTSCLRQTAMASLDSNSVSKNDVWTGPEDASLFSSAVEPKITKTSTQLENFLIEIEILKIMLENKKEPSVVAELLGERWAAFLKRPLQLTKQTN